MFVTMCWAAFMWICVLVGATFAAQLYGWTLFYIAAAMCIGAVIAQSP